MHARERGADQFVINLIRNRPACGLNFFQRASNSAISCCRFSMPRFDQSRIPPGRSIRLTSSPVNGAYPRATSRNRPPIFQASRRQQCSRYKPQPTQAGRRAVSFFALRCAPERDYGRIFAGTVHRESVTDCGCVFTSVTNAPEVFVPPLGLTSSSPSSCSSKSGRNDFR